jgi:hypothetical protein
LSQEKIGRCEPDEIDKASGAAAIRKAWRRISDTTRAFNLLEFRR